MRHVLCTAIIVLGLVAQTSIADANGRLQLERQAQVILTEFGIDADVSTLTTGQLTRIHLIGRNDSSRGNQLGLLRGVTRNKGGSLCFPGTDCLIRP